MSSRYEMVAAIDFGTSHSGYAYSYSYDKDTIIVNSNWKSGYNMFKVPTAILFDNHKRFVTFGYDAEDRYTQLAESQEEQSYYFFYHFKMALYNEQDVHRNMCLTSVNGRIMNAIDVFSAAIDYMKKHLIQAVNDRNSGNQVAVKNIRWVLTVPAIWSDAAKQFMREAGEEAGIPSKCLQIALEPECASLSLKVLPGVLEIPIDLNKPGTKYIVLDCGGKVSLVAAKKEARAPFNLVKAHKGEIIKFYKFEMLVRRGTVDSTVHEVLEQRRVKELYKVSGGDWGSIKIDQLYIRCLERIFTKEVIDVCREESPSDWIEMMRKFENIKRSLKYTEQGEYVISLQTGLLEAYEKVHSLSVYDGLSGRLLSDGARLRGKTRMQIPTSVFVDMVKRVCKEIMSHIHDLLINKIKDVHAIVLVGGFSNSQVLLQGIEEIRASLHILRPRDADLAVIKGAVFYGWNPKVISSRRSKRTYGLHMTETFDPDKHPQRLKIIADGRAKCDKIFDTLIAVNEEAPLGKLVTRRYHPLRNNVTLMKLRLFSSNSARVKFCDENSVKYIGELTVPMPDTAGGRDRMVQVKIQFGETEIQINGFDETSRNQVNAKFDFLTQDSTQE